MHRNAFVSLITTSKFKSQVTHTRDLLICYDVIYVTYLESWIFISQIIINILAPLSKLCLSYLRLISQSLTLGSLSRHLGTPLPRWFSLAYLAISKQKGMPYEPPPPSPEHYISIFRGSSLTSLCQKSWYINQHCNANDVKIGQFFSYLFLMKLMYCVIERFLRLWYGLKSLISYSLLPVT